MFIAVVFSLAIGIGIGYGFRGYISRTKAAAVTAVKADAVSAASKL